MILGMLDSIFKEGGRLALGDGVTVDMGKLLTMVDIEVAVQRYLMESWRPSVVAVLRPAIQQRNWPMVAHLIYTQEHP